jgi:hypothetical protein
MKIYLCGPINGCTDSECKDWRNVIKEIFPGQTIDPMDRDYRGREDDCYKEIVELDRLDILNSTVLLVNYEKPSVGTSMEIFYAHSLAIPVFVVCRSGTTISPWLRYHTTEFFSSFNDAINRIKNL